MRSPCAGWVALFCLLLLLGRERTTLAQSEDDEYRVKAAFLFHFAQLVDWPHGGGANGATSLAICTFGDDPFQGALESTIAGKQIGSKTIRILHVRRVDDLPNCQMLFLGHAQDRQTPALLETLVNAPLLTVGETPGFRKAGGMICFLLQDDKVRFVINLEPAENAGLKIDSRLLVLAQKIERESGAR